MSDPALDREALALLEALSEVPAKEREAWILRNTEGRADLRDRLRALLAAERRFGLQTGGAAHLLDEDAEPPARVGPYRIAGLIGRGGMGAVYLGEREAGDFARRVAIKIIKPGLLSEGLVERFLRERQILAGLSHPNIAQLYDGGQMEDGSPFFVMELVEGSPLIDWAEDTGAGRHERLAVFMQICAGVAFAHRNLVVHRDLTPSNVLVRPDGTVKLIDFGIARPAAPGAPERSGPPSGSLESLSLTPGFAAPERAAGTSATTLADIYSLGRLLEALLPGERDPELAAIIARAAAPAPAERYPTVEALAADVAAFGAQRPVAAMGTQRRYLWRKFVARNRRAVTLAGLGAAGLLGAFALTGWSLYRAEGARAAEAQRFAEVRDLAGYLLFDLNDRLAAVPGNVAARADLAARAQTYLDNLAATPAAPSDLQLEIAQGLIRLAQIQGVPDEPNLGEPDLAEANLARALNILAGVPDGPARAVAEARAHVFASLILLHARSRQEEAATRLEEAETGLLGVPAAARDEDWHRARRALRLATLEHADLSDTRERIPAIAAALRADHAAWPAALRATDLDERDEAAAAYYEALRLSFAGDPAALDLYLANERRFDALLGAQPFDAWLLYRAAWNSFDAFADASRQGRNEEARRLIGKTGAAVDRLLAVDPQDHAARSLAANVREGLAQSLRDEGRFAEAIALQRRVVAERRASLEASGNSSLSLGNAGFSLAILGVIARDAGDRRLACDSFIEGEALFAEAAARDELLGFQAAMHAGLQQKREQCRSGAAIDGPLIAPG